MRIQIYLIILSFGVRLHLRLLQIYENYELLLWNSFDYQTHFEVKNLKNSFHWFYFIRWKYFASIFVKSRFNSKSNCMRWRGYSVTCYNRMLKYIPNTARCTIDTVHEYIRNIHSTPKKMTYSDVQRNRTHLPIL